MNDSKSLYLVSCHKSKAKSSVNLRNDEAVENDEYNM